MTYFSLEGIVPITFILDFDVASPLERGRGSVKTRREKGKGGGGGGMTRKEQGAADRREMGVGVVAVSKARYNACRHMCVSGGAVVLIVVAIVELW
jgi:hypothetical protein